MELKRHLSLLHLPLSLCSPNSVSCILLNLPYASSALIKTFLVFTSLTSLNSSWDLAYLVPFLHVQMMSLYSSQIPSSTLCIFPFCLWAQTQASCPAMLTWNSCSIFCMLEWTAFVLWGSCPHRSTSNFALKARAFSLDYRKSLWLGGFPKLREERLICSFSWLGDLEQTTHCHLCLSALWHLVTSSLPGSSFVSRQNPAY